MAMTCYVIACRNLLALRHPNAWIRNLKSGPSGSNPKPAMDIGMGMNIRMATDMGMATGMATITMGISRKAR